MQPNCILCLTRSVTDPGAPRPVMSIDRYENNSSVPFPGCIQPGGGDPGAEKYKLLDDGRRILIEYNYGVPRGRAHSARALETGLEFYRGTLRGGSNNPWFTSRHDANLKNQSVGAKADCMDRWMNFGPVKLTFGVPRFWRQKLWC